MHFAKISQKEFLIHNCLNSLEKKKKERKDKRGTSEEVLLIKISELFRMTY